MSVRLVHRGLLSTVVALLGTLVLAGCGSSSSSSASPAGAVASGGAPGFSMSSAQQKKVRTCLKAAGLSSSLPSGRPSGLPSGGFTGSPNAFPSGGASGAPSGGPSGAPNGRSGGFGDPEVQAALQACGISLPGRPTTPSGGASGQ